MTKKPLMELGKHYKRVSVQRTCGAADEIGKMTLQTESIVEERKKWDWGLW